MDRQKIKNENWDVFGVDSLSETIVWGMVILFFLLSHLLGVEGVSYIALLIVIASAAIFTVVWMHFLPVKYQTYRKVSIGTIVYSMVISAISILTGGSDSPVFTAFVMPTLVAVYALPPKYVMHTSVSTFATMIFEFLFDSYLKGSIGYGLTTYIIRFSIYGAVSVLGYFLSLSRDENRVKLGEVVEELEERQIRQKEAIHELIETERSLRQKSLDIEKRNKELELMRRSMLNILEDLDTERQNIEVEKDKFEAVLRSTNEGIFMVDENETVNLVNKAFTEMFDISENKVLGADSREFIQLSKGYFAHEDEFKEWVEEINSKSVVQELDWEMKSSPARFIKRFTTPVRGTKKKRIGRLWTFRDITRDRELDNMRKDFVSLASHQLRTPLSSIRWFLEMLLSGDFGKLDKKQKDVIQKTYDSSLRMIDLVNSLLNVSRIESGRIAVNPTPVQLTDICKEIVESLSPLFKQKKHKVSFKCGKDIPTIKLDERLIRESIANLVSNSIKYTPEGGKIEIELKKKKTNVEISVKDNGIGIPKDEHKRVFSKFYRSESAVMTETEGSGLGLYIAKSVVESSGGKMWFESELDKGSTFYISLPIKGSKAKKGETTLT